MGKAARNRDLFGQRIQQVAVPEIRLQCAIADVLRYSVAPGWVWTHFPAGEKRDPVTAAKLQRMGLNPGWPDFILLDGRDHADVFTYFLELKSQNGQMSPDQRAFASWFCEHIEAQARYRVVRSFEQAVSVLKQWGAVQSISV